MKDNIAISTRERRFAEAESEGGRWLLEIREEGGADPKIDFLACGDFQQALSALQAMLARPQLVSLLGLYDLRVPLKGQGVGLSPEEFYRRARPILAESSSRYVNLRSERGLALLCDPIGSGDKAAQWAIEELSPSLDLNLDSSEDRQIKGLIGDSLSVASRHIWQRGQRERDLDGVGAAVVVAYVRGNCGGDFDFFAVWAGDCRAYLWQESRLKLLTRDDFDLQIPISRPLVQYLGIGELAPHGRSGKMAAGDRLLLCNQAFAVAMSEREIAAALSAGIAPEQVCRQLQTSAAAKRPGQLFSLAILEPSS